MATTANEVAASSRCARLLNGLARVRMMKITNTCVASDSTNQPVRNSALSACNTASSSQKVRKSKMELTGPMVIMNVRIKPMSQRRGRARSSSSTLSAGSGNSDRS